ncbi:NINE protein [Rhodococcus erythropolis]|uniref:TM2 domain-containing protein n=1 Tax=Rhodococcus erythropolis TaxID=1833 RepID=UPI003D0E91D7
MNKNPEPSESGDSSGSQPPDPPQFGSPFDYDATADASLTETSAPTEKTPSTETTGTGPGWDTYSGVGNGPGWGNHPIYPPPTGTESTTAFPTADSDSTPNQPTAPYTSQESYAAQNYPATDYPAPDYSRPTQTPTDGPVYGAPADQTPNPYAAPPQGYPAAPPQGSQNYGQQQGYPQPGYSQPGYGQPQGYPQAQGYPQPGFGLVDPSAPYGRDPMTGEPYSDKSKTTAGLLGILLGGFGAGRFYLNQPGMAVAQIAVTWLTCGIGGIWPLIDGIMMLTGSVRDQYNRPLRS